MILAGLLLSCAQTPDPAGATPVQPPPGSDGVLERAAPEARAAWRRLCAASGPQARGPGEPSEIRAFRLEAEILTRQGVQTNETRIEYSYLAPDCIRFVLPSRNETGRFGPAQDQYWLRSGDEVLTLAGREYSEDRRQVDEMIVLARNYVALSDPARIELLTLELLPAPPADLGAGLARRAGKLRWLALESRDFALVRQGEDGSLRRDTVYRVELGLDAGDQPALAAIRERPGPGRELGNPLLVEFDAYRERDGFRVPCNLKVRVIDPGLTPPAFARDASQEVYVTRLDLRPELQVADFRP